MQWFLQLLAATISLAALGMITACNEGLILAMPKVMPLLMHPFLVSRGLVTHPQKHIQCLLHPNNMPLRLNLRIGLSWLIVWLTKLQWRFLILWPLSKCNCSLDHHDGQKLEKWDHRMTMSNPWLILFSTLRFNRISAFGKYLTHKILKLDVDSSKID